MDEKRIIHKFKLGRDVLIITITGLIILLGIPVMLFFLDTSNTLIWLRLGIATVTLIVSLWVASYALRNISIKDGILSINMLMHQKNISFESIMSVERIESNMISGSIRTFGIGGIFGYIGHFKNKKLGNYSMYSTSRKDLVLITLNNNKRVVTNCTDEGLLIILDLL